MPSPLSEAFRAAARVRPALTDIVRYDDGREWTMNRVPITEKEAERLILGACIRLMPMVRWFQMGDGTYCVVNPSDVASNFGHTLALLSAVAGLGGG